MNIKFICINIYIFTSNCFIGCSERPHQETARLEMVLNSSSSDSEKNLTSDSKQNMMTNSLINNSNQVRSAFDSCFFENILKQHNSWKQNEHQTVFRLFENHHYDESGQKSLESSCRVECNNSNLDAIYESLLSKNLMKDPEFKMRASKVFRKIVIAMEAELTSRVFEESILQWVGLKSNKSIKNNWQFPSLQLQSQFRQAQLLFHDNLQAAEYLLELQHSPDHETADLPFFAFQFSYLTFFSKLDSKNDIKLSLHLLKDRDTFYRSFLGRLRGNRADKTQRVEGTQVGIVPFDIPELESASHIQPWRHPARDVCINDPDGSAYNRSATSRQIPLSCGLSGTTNIALWSLFAFKVELSEEEMLDFLLAAWTVLCFDGGHSLQEVLTTAKILSTYLDLQVKNPGYIRDQFSPSLFASLGSATENILPLGLAEDPLSNTKNRAISSVKEIEKKILNHSYFVGEQDNIFLNSPDEQKIRKELEFYFEYAGKATGKTAKEAQFGTYYDAFFSKIKAPSFDQVREVSQKELLHYVESRCSNVSDSL